MSWKKNKKQKKDSQNFCGQEGQEAMYILSAETEEQSYFLTPAHKFSHLHINSHTCTVVSIPAESRITKAVEQSLCICISGIVPAADVGIMNKLIYV